MNGLVMLLPHGYEGQGAEHSSARLERFLQLCAEDNMQVVNCTSPANFFHLIRRQMHREFRKPLIVFTPKSLLRHPKCVSAIADLSKGGFQEVIDDSIVNAKSVKRVVFCSGKVYYDLLERQAAEKEKDIAIVRIEQLYPFPKKQLNAIVAKYKNADELIWLQEEPENMGAWSYFLRTWTNAKLKVIARAASASPATGSHKQHDKEQHALVEKAFEKAEISALI
jgi:2-oxoglutarate dehydrogenase E1 component